MLRRLFTLGLMLACALAPALPALETAPAVVPECCCGKSCCGDPHCAPPPAPARAVCTVPVAVAAESRATTAKPAARAVFVRSFYPLEKLSARSASGFAATRLTEIVASAPLFRAHCTLLL